MSRPISLIYVNESLALGGAERQMVELIKHLNRDQFTVQVVTYFPADFFGYELKQLGVPVHKLVRHGKLDFKPVAFLARLLRSGEVDLIHAHLPAANFYGVAAKMISRCGRVVVTEQSSVSALSGLSRIYTPFAYRWADVTVANSATARADLIRKFHLAEERVRFIPGGVSMDRFSPGDAAERYALRQRLGWPASQHIALTVGSIKEAKNFPGYVEAIAGLGSQSERLEFYWAGPAPYPKLLAEVQQALRHYQIDHLIHLLGPRDDLIDLYRACDVFVLNSLWEGTPTVVLEALACGRPVIATDVSDVARYVIPGRTGWLVPRNDPAALRAALIEAAHATPEQLDALGRAGREHLISLGMDSGSLVRQHEQIYMSLCSRA
jgi:glycosyltransferase involved in cell wall biosynthesis